MHRLILGLVAAGLLVACATSPLGRRQLILFPEEQLTEMGVAAFQQVKQEKPSVSGAYADYVRCITDAITAQLREGPDEWEVEVFEDETPNAFALPGGKVGVHTGILKLAETPSQLATVIAHEVVHVIAEHPNERVSTAYATQAGLDLAGAVLAGGQQSRELAGLLGLGAQYGFLLPFNRTQESEADLYGLDLMARAGFDPRESITFWQNMQAASEANGPPEFLSTHPSGTHRIRDLQGRMEKAVNIYRESQAAGRTPDCKRP